ncbi:hypothetical protein [Pedobacter boryungensis]|uniref:Uncharacterized protein n=1 Tax=Pedobacter boryungensis TaxID=869962 RepID=A0ABX2DAP1_9SPHI|nr:hypothetical protein [Pedobacter boryungensis]NQX31090.1 hypothetical protein [Pedobacter boryungensis]
MENQDTTKRGNSSKTDQGGTTVPIATPQDKNPAIKEGDPAQQRPEYGSKGGPNTSTREDQLPTLDENTDGKSQGKE